MGFIAFHLLTAYSSSLTFSLETGWAFVETEDWRKDLEASWTDIESDNGGYIGIDLWMSGSEFLYFFLTYLDGWIYTNDTWMDPRSTPAGEWITSGVTRRRRWTRRIYRTQDTS